MSRRVVVLIAMLFAAGVVVLGCSLGGGGAGARGARGGLGAGAASDEGLDLGDGGGPVRGVGATSAGKPAAKPATKAAPAPRPASATAAGGKRGAKRGAAAPAIAPTPRAGAAAGAAAGARAGGGGISLGSIPRDAQGYPKSWTDPKTPSELRSVKERIYGAGLPRGREIPQGPTMSEINAAKQARLQRGVPASEKRIVPGGAGMYALVWAGVTGQTGLMTKWYRESKSAWGGMRPEADSIVGFYGVDWRQIKVAPGAPGVGALVLAQATARPGRAAAGPAFGAMPGPVVRAPGMGTGRAVGGRGRREEK